MTGIQADAQARMRADAFQHLKTHLETHYLTPKTQADAKVPAIAKTGTSGKKQRKTGVGT